MLIPEIRRSEGEDHEKVDKEGVQDMYRKVHDVIPRHVKTSEVVVQGKGEIADIPAGIVVIALRARYEVVEVPYERVIGDIVEVVKLEGDIECVRISDETDYRYEKKTERFFFINLLTFFLKLHRRRILRELFSTSRPRYAFVLQVFDRCLQHPHFLGKTVVPFTQR